MAKKENISSLSIYRALAMLAVLFIHATSEAIAKTKGSDLFFGYNFINTFSKFAVPSFIMLTCFVLFYNYGGRKLDGSMLTGFYRKRLKYILLPYFICSICFFTLIHFTHYPNRELGDTLSSLAIKLLTGSAYTHLYYVFLIIQFYIIFPLMLLVLRSTRVAAWAIPIGLILQWGFVIWNKYDLQVTSKGSLLISYASYVMLGAYLGIYWDRVKGWFQGGIGIDRGRYRLQTVLLWLSWLTVGLAHVLLWHATHLHKARVNTLWYEGLWNVHSLLSCIVLLQAAAYIERKWSSSTVQKISRFGDMTFGIYLLHPLFLLVYRRFQWHDGDPLLYPLYIAGAFAVALFVTWAVVALLYRYVKFAWIFFGTGPRPTTVSMAKPDADGRTLGG
ncbi:acyltransferase [Paenibacillus sp. 481]|uniref:acyltransferase n=1 Tax=Paenibacillus sp. 481 TaxID=2835869 RepID=UPI001E48BB23|nr:acyltransferase [Paenibacillus sp. 481]UHA75222.1 acyltransferase [Paenibacillus sp. 481]